MPHLKPLEFRDCVVDGPSFRDALLDHEKELKASSKQVKEIYSKAERVFEAMDHLQKALSDFSKTLSQCSVTGPVSPLNASAERLADRNSQTLTETDDEVIITTACSKLADMILTVEEARSVMLNSIKNTVLNEISELRTVWLAGQKTDSKSFLKDTSSFCQKLEKYTAIKLKEQSNEVDKQMEHDRERFITQAFEHVTNIHEAEELKKSKFVQTISLFVQMLGNFYHQAYEHFNDSQSQLSGINIATQRSAENFRQISDETRELKEKLIKTPWENIQCTDASICREGYLFIPTKKVTTTWVKHFSIYNRETKRLKVTPYTQGRTTDVPMDTFIVTSCTRRPSDSMERRFCFELEVEHKSAPLILQAQSRADLEAWMRVMDGKEPTYADPMAIFEDPYQTRLSQQGSEFVSNLLEMIEHKDLHMVGLYRISGGKSKITALVTQALSPAGVTRADLLAADIHVLTGAVRHYIRHLEDPLMTFDLHHRFLTIGSTEPRERILELRRLVALLPQENQKILKALCVHLSKVAAESRFNNMTASNLGIVFAPSLLRSREETVAAIMNMRFASIVVELLITHHHQVVPVVGRDGRFIGEYAEPSNGVRQKAEPIYSIPVAVSKVAICDLRNSDPVVRNCVQSRTPPETHNQYKANSVGRKVGPPSPSDDTMSHDQSQSITTSSPDSANRLAHLSRHPPPQPPLSNAFARNNDLVRRRRPTPAIPLNGSAKLPQLASNAIEEQSIGTNPFPDDTLSQRLVSTVDSMENHTRDPKPRDIVIVEDRSNPRLQHSRSVVVAPPRPPNGPHITSMAESNNPSPKPRHHSVQVMMTHGPQSVTTLPYANCVNIVKRKPPAPPPPVILSSKPKWQSGQPIDTHRRTTVPSTIVSPIELRQTPRRVTVASSHVPTWSSCSS